MALSSADHLRGRPVEVVFAGLRSDTYTMQRAGWRIAMEARSYADIAGDCVRFAFKHDDVGVALFGDSHVESMSRSLGELLAPIIIRQAFHAESRARFTVAPSIASFLARDDALRTIDATPAFAQVTDRELFEMPFFQTLHVPQVEPLIVEPETVSELLEKIRRMQAPEQAAIRTRNAGRQASAGRIHAHIMSIAA